MVIADLCAGIGGFSLAAEWMGWETAFFSEIEPNCSAWLADNFPGVPNLGDLKTIDWTHVPRIDVLTAGFPCQPVSVAGNQKGVHDDRWLWPDVARAVRVLRPRYVVVENTPGLASANDGRALGEVLGDLASLLYDAEGHRLSAADLGAAHERERVWIVAYTDTERRELSGQSQRSELQSEAGREPHGRDDEVGDTEGGRCEQHHARKRSGIELDARRAAMGDTAERRSEVVGDADDERREKQRGAESARTERGCAERAGRELRAAVPWHDAVAVRGYDGTVRRIPRHAAENGPQSPLWPLAARFPGRVAQIAAIGNSISPIVACELFRRIEFIDANGPDAVML